jgi:dipeptidyl aminopeptidase/acylaminoacyl peptidase
MGNAFTIVRNLVFVILLTLPELVMGQVQTLPTLIDRALFFDDPQITLAQLSPNGVYTSFIKPYQGALNIWIKKRDAPFSTAIPVTASNARPIKSYFWSKDSRSILYILDKGGDENFSLFAIDIDTLPARTVPLSRDLIKSLGSRTQLYRIAATNPNLVYVGINDRDKSWYDLYEVNIRTGQRTCLYKNTSRISEWYFDWRDKPRAVLRSAETGETQLLAVQQQSDDSLTFKLVMSHDVFEECAVAGIHKDNNQIYVISNKGTRNFRELLLVDLTTGIVKTVERDPLNRVDFAGLMLSEKSKLPLFVTYNDERIRRYWKDASFSRDFKLITKTLSDADIQFTSSSLDERFWLLTTISDVDPGSTYLLDRQQKKLTLQFHSRPQLLSADLAKMQPIRYPSSDGLEIPAYLTLPKGVPARKLPLIVLPHGGPWNRTSWGFNPYHQLLANRGYAVLSPNFRASTGYGKSFLLAGNHQWGDKMQDDLTWGVKYLVESGLVDSSRVGIMGLSYGGYASLAGIAFTPSLYKAAVAICAPSNLITLLNSLPKYWASTLSSWHNYLGNPAIEQDRRRLERQSPLFSVDKIKTPLFLAHGANDARVKRQESDQIVVALRERNFPVEYLVAPDEGHGFQRPINVLAMLVKVEQFLAFHLGGRVQNSVSNELQQRIQLITVDPAKVQVTPIVKE